MPMDIKALTTREGVAALRSMVTRLNQSAINLVTSANDVQKVFDNEISNLGPYQNTYDDMVNFARLAILDASGDIESLKNRLTSTANEIENWLNQSKPDSSSGTIDSRDDSWPSPPVDVKKKVR